MLTTLERVLFLQEVPLLAGLPTEALIHLAGLAREEVLEEGAPLWKTGSAADAIFFVLDGEIAIGGLQLAATGATRGADLGAAALISPDAHRDTTAIALRETQLLRVGRDDFFDVLADHPAASRALLETIGQRLSPLPSELDVGV